MGARLLCCLIAVGAFFLTPLAAHACGTDRWPPKVLTDQDAASINFTPVDTTIAALTALPAPSTLPYDRRIVPTETTQFRLSNVRLSAITPSADGDYVLTLQDAAGNRILAESPDPSCMSPSFADAETKVRAAIAGRFGRIMGPLTSNVDVTVAGVGFFDYMLGASASPPQARNGIELHPLLSLCFGTNCAGSGTAPAVSSSSTPASASTASVKTTSVHRDIIQSPPTKYEQSTLGLSPGHYYLFNESSGPTAYDSASSPTNGSYIGSVTFGSSGPIVNDSTTAISLPGGSRNVGVSVPNPGAGIGTSYSISTWVYPILGTDYMAVWGASSTARLLVSSSGALLTQFNGNFFSKNAVSPNSWHQVVFVYNAGTKTESYYIDGLLDSSATLSNSLAAFSFGYYVGQSDTSTSYKWHGKLAQHAFYNYALSGSQIASNYEAAGYTPSGGSTPTPPQPGCSGYRWTIKVATDSAASSISLTPQPTTIASLTALTAPPVNSSAPRIQGTETTNFQLSNVILTEIMTNPDGDYHLALSDGNGHTMVAESPHPTCGTSSTLSSYISQVRTTINAQYGNFTDLYPNATVSMRGIGFFDTYAQSAGPV